MANTFYDKQIKNRNFLSPTGFKFNLARTPKVDFFSNSARIPGITLGDIMVGNYLKGVPVPGDQVQFEDLTMSFIVDESLENYLEIHNWIYGLGYPKTVDQFQQIGRINNYTTNSFEEFIGSKTNIWFNGANQRLKIRKNIPQKTIILVPYEILCKKEEKLVGLL